MADRDTSQAEDMLPISEFARRCGVSIGTIRTWERAGKIAAVRTPGGQRRFAASELARALQPSPSREAS